MGRHWALLAGLLLFLTRTGAAEPVRQLCQQRDAWCARKTFVWQATADNSLQISKQERAMLETRAMSGGIQIASRTWVHGRLAIMRRPGLTYVESVHDRCSHPWLNGRFGYWLGREFAVIAPANTPNVYSPPSALVLPVPGDALYWDIDQAFGDAFAPGMHPAFLAGTDPLRTFSPFRVFKWRRAAWVPAGTMGALAVYRLSGVPTLHAEIALDGTRQYAPVYFRAQEQAYRTEYRVQEWKRYDGWWMPARIVCQTGDGSTTSTVVYVLTQIRDSPADMHIILPSGTPVKDLRHIPPETIAATGLLFIQQPAYTYSWAGSLPQKEAVPAVGTKSGPAFIILDAPDQPRQAQSSSSVWWLVVPLLLIAIGAFWYWRVRQGERKT